MTQQEIENRLWDAADELRVAMPEAQYSSVVFPLMFWKYLSDTWEHQHEVFLAENDGLLEDLSPTKPTRSNTATTSRSRSR
ncbi:type I restriction-modification system subunit M N-terminal domain-containing protein [Rhodococcus sp. C26F]